MRYELRGIDRRQKSNPTGFGVKCTGWFKQERQLFLVFSKVEAKEMFILRPRNCINQ
jgi:hypothetical protein